MNIQNIIPAPYRVGAAVAAITVAAASLYVWGWLSGGSGVQAQWDAERAAQATALAERASKQAQADARVVTRYVDRVRIVRESGDTLTREVKTHVPPDADAACLVPDGFVRLHNAAANGLPVADAAGDSDARSAPVALSAVAETVADNYTDCRETREQLIALQTWAKSLAHDGGE